MPKAPAAKAPAAKAPAGQKVQAFSKRHVREHRDPITSDERWNSACKSTQEAGIRQIDCESSDQHVRQAVTAQGSGFAGITPASVVGVPPPLPP